MAGELDTTIYRLVQEALTNVAKHAREDRVRVAVGVADGGVAIEVSDDGVGVDPDVATSGFGLAGMRERVALSGGQLAVAAGDPGTTVLATIPRCQSSTSPCSSAYRTRSARDERRSFCWMCDRWLSTVRIER